MNLLRLLNVNIIPQKIEDGLIAAASYGLNILVPVVPAFIWDALITAVLEGNVTLEHIQQFLKDHNIQAYAEYPAEKDKFG